MDHDEYKQNVNTDLLSGILYSISIEPLLKHLRENLSYRGRVPVGNNLASLILWHCLTVGLLDPPPELLHQLPKSFVGFVWSRVLGWWCTEFTSV